MSEKYPLHIMIKPEGLENFEGHIRGKIKLLEKSQGSAPVVEVITTLSPEQVRLIYGDKLFPANMEQLTTGRTKHIIIQGNEDIYEEAWEMKGKVYPPSGLRGELRSSAENSGLKLERWQNFIHTADNPEETMPICREIIDAKEKCEDCAIREICWKNQDHTS